MWGEARRAHASSASKKRSIRGGASGCSAERGAPAARGARQPPGAARVGHEVERRERHVGAVDRAGERVLDQQAELVAAVSSTWSIDPPALLNGRSPLTSGGQ